MLVYTGNEPKRKKPTLSDATTIFFDNFLTGYSIIELRAICISRYVLLNPSVHSQRKTTPKYTVKSRNISTSVFTTHL